MINLTDLNSYRKEYMGMMGDSNHGRFLIPSFDGKKMYHILASNAFGWEHVSMSLRTVDHPETEMIERCPFWLEMMELKKLFFLDDETVMQIYPKEKDYINNHPYVLHIWRRIGNNITVPNQINPQVKTKEVLTDTHKYSITIYQDLSWTKASVLIKNKKGNTLDRYPRWDELCEAKRAIFNGEQAAVLFMDNTVTDDYSLAWWYSHDDQIPLPDSHLVGIKGLKLNL